MVKDNKTQKISKKEAENAEAQKAKMLKQKRHQVAVAHYELGLEHRDLQEFNQATDHFEIAIEYDENFIPPRYENLLIMRDVEDEPKMALGEAQAIYNIDKTFMAPEFMDKIVPDLVKAVDTQKAAFKRTPVTILTGFLGSGKTTLLNRILAEPHGHKIAVIENEYGAVGIDEKLVVMNESIEGEGIIEIMNGCICCTVREDLATTLQDMKAKYVDTGKIDYIIIETTGMADPGPVISTFLIHPDIQDWCYVDSCITVCDATQIIAQLSDDREEGCENEAVEQVCFADKILLNKIDLVDSTQLAADVAKIREYNSAVVIANVQLNNAELPFGELLDQRSFDIARCLDMDPTLVAQDAFADHKHDSRIGTFSWRLEAEMTKKSGKEFIMKILQEKGANLYRMKGFLAIEGSKQKLVFHSVGMLTSMDTMGEWEPGEKRECVIVIIGKHLNQVWLENQILNACTSVPKELQQIKHPQELLDELRAQEEQEKSQVQESKQSLRQQNSS